MAKSIHIGFVACAHCGNEATVHEQQTGNKKGARYYRCYTEPGGLTMRCGTVQILGPTGQKYIADNMRPIGSGQARPEPIGQPQTAPAEPAPQPIDTTPPAPEPIADTPPAKKGWLSGLLTEDDDD